MRKLWIGGTLESRGVSLIGLRVERDSITIRLDGRSILRPED
jgi:hypothetical protein